MKFSYVLQVPFLFLFVSKVFCARSNQGLGKNRAVNLEETNFYRALKMKLAFGVACVRRDRCKYKEKIARFCLGISNKRRKCVALVQLVGAVRLAIGKAACIIFLNRMLIN